VQQLHRLTEQQARDLASELLRDWGLAPAADPTPAGPAPG